jgi:CO/xanthine dehydrogenase Mo-binding subunit
MTTVVAPETIPGILSTDDVRVEGREKVSGRTKYSADMQPPGLLWAAFTTSPYAHAKILSIETSAAKAVPGVKAVLTSADIGPGKRSGRMLYDLPVLAYDKVIYIGDRVAAVAAETREAAEEAARLVEVEYEELPAVVDAMSALAPDAPVIHPERDSYFFAAGTPPPRDHPNVQGSHTIRKGDADLAPHFANAYRVYEHTFETPRQHAGYMEPRAVVVWIDEAGVVHVYSPNKQPFALKNWLAKVIGIPPESVIVESAAIGGDFGGKGMSYDEFPCYYLAKATGRPVKRIASYVDELSTATVRHKAYVRVKTAVDENGKFLAHESEVLYDGGAYAAGKPGPTLCPGMNGYSTVGYQVPHVLATVRTAYTNTITGAHVRAPADVQIFFAWEQHVDLIAADLGIDPIELRMLNVSRPGETSVSNEYLAHPMGYAVLEALKREIDAPLPAGRAWGYALVCRHTGGGKTSIDVTLDPSGSIDVVCGVPDQGSGIATVVRRVMAGTMGIAAERIGVRHGSTASAPADPGSGGSRVTHIVGQCARIAGEDLRARLEAALGTTLDDGNFERGAATLTGATPLTVSAAFDATHHDEAHPADFSFTGFAFDVSVDRDTGVYTIHDAVVVADVGEIINPIAHQGQIEGGFIYGLGSATMEEMPIDESGKVTTLSLGEYKVPTIRDIPPLRTVLVQAPPANGPYGSKMAGELTTSGVAPAIVNAIARATGARIYEFPVTSERVYTALHANG